MYKLLALLLILSGTANAAVLDVCAACTYTTIGSAFTAAGSTDIIEIQDNSIVAETLFMNKNIAGFRSNGTFEAGTAKNWGSAGITLNISGSTITQSILFENLTMASTGGNVVSTFGGLASGGNLTFQNMVFDHTGGTGNTFDLNSAVSSGGLVKLDRVRFIGNASSPRGIAVSGQTQANTWEVMNCEFNGYTNSNAFLVEFSDSQAIEIFKMYNCTLNGSGGISSLGLSTGNRADIRNNVFTNNNADLSCFGQCNGNDVTDFVNNAFEQQGAPFGTGSVFGITDAVYIDEVIGDLRVKDTASATYDAGISTSPDVTTDLFGIARPQDVAYDISCYERPDTAIVLTGRSDAVFGSASVHTWSHTVPAGTDRALVVGFATNQGTDVVTSVTFNGTAMTKENCTALSPTLGCLFTLLSPDAVTGDIVVTMSASDKAVGAAVSYVGVGSVGTIQTASANSFNPTDTLTTIQTGSVIVQGLAWKNNSTLLGNYRDGYFRTKSSDTTTGGGGNSNTHLALMTAWVDSIATYTMDYTLAISREWVSQSIELQEAGAPPVGGAAIPFQVIFFN